MNNFEFGERFKHRTKDFALRIIRLYQSLPRMEAELIVGKQLLRSATSVAANYRAACRARSRKEFAAKINIVLEEADETQFWLEILEESGMVPADRLNALKKESAELVAIVTSIRTSLRKNKSAQE